MTTVKVWSTAHKVAYLLAILTPWFGVSDVTDRSRHAARESRAYHASASAASGQRCSPSAVSRLRYLDLYTLRRYSRSCGACGHASEALFEQIEALTHRPRRAASAAFVHSSVAENQWPSNWGGRYFGGMHSH